MVWSKPYLALLSIALSLLSTCTAFDAWHADYIYTLAMEELDPVVSPNQQSSHMHRIIGMPVPNLYVGKGRLI
jgi:hypothetical protein